MKESETVKGQASVLLRLFSPYSTVQAVTLRGVTDVRIYCQSPPLAYHQGSHLFYTRINHNNGETDA